MSDINIFYRTTDLLSALKALVDHNPDESDSDSERYHFACMLIQAAGFIAAPYLKAEYALRADRTSDRDKAKEIIDDVLGWAADPSEGLGEIANQIINALRLVEGGEPSPLYDPKPDDPRRPKRRPVSGKNHLSAALVLAAKIQRDEKCSFTSCMERAAKKSGLTPKQLQDYEKTLGEDDGLIAGYRPIRNPKIKR
jgi:hypothetical protein